MDLADRKPKLFGVHVLKGFAFCLVFAAHAGNSFTDFGALAVSLFFSISGFLMVYNYYDSGKIQNTGIKANIIFAYKRVSSLYILHILTTLGMLFLKAEKDKLLSWIAQFVFNLMLVQSWYPSPSINPAAWYLSSVIFSYFLFPYILYYLENRKPSLKRVATSILIVFAVQIVLCQIGGLLGSAINHDKVYIQVTKWIAYKHPIVRATDFIMGCLIGYIFIQKRDEEPRISKLSVVSVIVSTISVIIFLFMKIKYGPESADRPERWWTYCVIFSPCSLLLTWIFANDNGWLVKLVKNRFFVFCGNISASAFLIHIVIINYIYNIDCFAWLDNSLTLKIVRVLLCFGITIITTKLWDDSYSKMKRNGQRLGSHE